MQKVSLEPCSNIFAVKRYRCEVMQNIFFLCGYWNASEVAYIKGK